MISKKNRIQVWKRRQIAQNKNLRMQVLWKGGNRKDMIKLLCRVLVVLLIVFVVEYHVLLFSHPELTDRQCLIKLYEILTGGRMEDYTKELEEAKRELEKNTFLMYQGDAYDAGDMFWNILVCNKTLNTRGQTMAGISMCWNSENCKKRGTCYRVKATKSINQSYSAFFKEGEECSSYIKVIKGNSRR